MFPPIEPFDSGMLDVGDGHTVYWERCGNPDGRPVVYLHGGPGSGCSANQRRWFDPDQYHAVLIDQRGAGRSRPLASDPDADLSSNTTAHLISDIERVREHVGIDRWTVVGMSWGTTLGLAYAQAHPQRVSALLLGLVGTTSRREVDWITGDVGRIFPQQWDRFSHGVPESMRQLRLVDAYATLLFDPDPSVRDHAAREWCAWEDAHVSLSPRHQPSVRYQDPEFRLRFARLVTHYWRNAAFLDDDQLVRNAGVLNGIPGILLNGRFDVSGPLETAWRLTQSWNTCALQVVDDAGHGDGDSFPDAILNALARLARDRL
jgi:proline iminopeptidase